MRVHLIEYITCGYNLSDATYADTSCRSHHHMRVHHIQMQHIQIHHMRVHHIQMQHIQIHHIQIHLIEYIISITSHADTYCRLHY